MTTVIRLRSAIVAALTAVHPRVYFQSAIAGTAYPYLVYDLPNSFGDGTTERFVVDVDGWDKPAVQGSSGALELLMGEVERVLDRRVVHMAANGAFLAPYQYVEMDDSMAMTFYLDRRLSPRDDNPALLRRTYVFNVTVIQKRRSYHGWKS